MVIRVAILSSGDPAKSPPIGLPNERRKFGMFKVGRYDPDFELTGFENPPGSAVGHPGDDITQVGSGEDGLHLGREIWYPSERREGSQGIVIGAVRVIAVVEVWCGFQFPRHIFIFYLKADV